MKLKLLKQNSKIFILFSSMVVDNSKICLERDSNQPSLLSYHRDHATGYVNWNFVILHSLKQ